MSLAELLPEVDAPPRADKFRLMRLLVERLEEGEKTLSIPAGQIVEIWSPHEAYETATELQKLLDEDKAGAK